MTDQNFSEREIKEKLENLEVPYNPESWAKLEQRLNAPFVEEIPPAVEEVDKVVYPKIVRLETAYNEQHWKIMAARLRLIAARRKQVVSTKLLEMAIVLLILGNLPTWLGIEAPREQQFFIPKNGAIADWNEAGKKPGVANFSKKKPANGVAENINEPSLLGENRSPVFGNDGLVDPNKIREGTIFDKYGIQTAPGISLPLEFFNAIQDYFLDKKTEQGPAGPIAENCVSGLNSLNENKKALARFASLETIETRLAPVENPIAPAFLPLAYFFEKKPKRQLQVGVFLAPESNLIRTPSSEYGEPDIVQLVNGYACGLTFGQKKGRFGYETGLIYQAKNFSRPVEIIAGSVEAGFAKQLTSKQEYEIMGIPVRATAKIARVKHLSVSARAGFSANAVVQKNDIRQNVKIQNAAVPGSPVIAALFRKSKTEQRGLFEGGSLRENGFLTADAGFRFERPVGGRTSVYFEPVVQYTLKKEGIGARKDKLTTFSWQIGMTATL